MLPIQRTFIIFVSRGNAGHTTIYNTQSLNMRGFGSLQTKYYIR